MVCYPKVFRANVVEPSDKRALTTSNDESKYKFSQKGDFKRDKDCQQQNNLCRQETLVECYVVVSTNDDNKNGCEEKKEDNDGKQELLCQP